MDSQTNSKVELGTPLKIYFTTCLIIGAMVLPFFIFSLVVAGYNLFADFSVEYARVPMSHWGER